jgi:UDP-2,4-diacetamido-2,4,6-trideoxy-beta-L-altropyranose hydrolase
MNLIIRSDASVEIGTGHIMRCLALAQALQEQGGQAIFVFANKSSALENRLLLEGMQVVYLSVESGSTEDAKQTMNFSLIFNAQWIVIDGYQFGSEYQKIIKNSGVNLLFIDDYGHAEIYSADLVLNQNISAQSEWYQYRSPHTQLLLGERYTLLRKEFTTWRGYQKQITDNVKNILITLGGSDPNNITAWILEALQLVKIPSLHLTVVIGGSNPHHKSLEYLAHKCIHSIRLLKDVVDMPQLIAEADLAIAAGGSTNWELALLGLPSLILTLAENQSAIAQTLHEKGIVISLGHAEEVKQEDFLYQFESLCYDRQKREKMSQAGQTLIDGKGCDRILVKLQKALLRLRPVSDKDCKLIWCWSNEPTTRKASFQTALISWEDHTQWFQQKLQDLDCYFWIAMNEQDQPIGQVRLEAISPQVAQISISIDTEYRRNGLGTHLLTLGVQTFLSQTQFLSISAWIKSDNLASCQMFEKVDFIKIGSEYREGELAVHYQFSRREAWECITS